MAMLRTLYETTFIDLYRWSVRVNGEDDYNKLSASMMMSVLIEINLATLTLIYSALGGEDLRTLGVTETTAIVVLAILVLINYRYIDGISHKLSSVRSDLADKNTADKHSYITAAIVVGSLLLYPVLAILLLTFFPKG